MRLLGGLGLRFPFKYFNFSHPTSLYIDLYRILSEPKVLPNEVPNLPNDGPPFASTIVGQIWVRWYPACASLSRKHAHRWQWKSQDSVRTHCLRLISGHGRPRSHLPRSPPPTITHPIILLDHCFGTKTILHGFCGHVDKNVRNPLKSNDPCRFRSLFLK